MATASIENARWRDFPSWFVVREANGNDERGRSRCLIDHKALDHKGWFDSRPVAAMRFVRACPKQHVTISTGDVLARY